jgi:hypothetical protein
MYAGAGKLRSPRGPRTARVPSWLAWLQAAEARVAIGVVEIAIGALLLTGFSPQLSAAAAAILLAAFCAYFVALYLSGVRRTACDCFGAASDERSIGRLLLRNLVLLGLVWLAAAYAPDDLPFTRIELWLPLGLALMASLLLVMIATRYGEVRRQAMKYSGGSR